MNFGSTLQARTNNSAGYAGPRESHEERHAKLKALDLSVFDLFDTSKPWVLVENGSILGYFDWVPVQWRVGPWQSSAPAMLFALSYFAICGSVVAYQQQPSQTQNIDDYPALFSAMWYYNLFGFLWISGISIGVLFGPAGPRAWSTFTMWSWTVLQVRHGLSVIVPWLGPNSFLFKILELSQFPMLMMHTLTFFVWNFILMPFVYFFLMDNEEKRKNFLAYFTRFRLIQVHVFNILFACLNGVWASPRRVLTLSDFMASYVITVVYALWYTLILDRVGVHLYPIFSPRNPFMAITWVLVMLAQVGGFALWTKVLAP